MSTEEKVDALLLNAIVNGHSSIETYFHGLSENDRRALATQALSWAITVENVTKAEQLLSYGAAVNIREPSGSTLLHVAASRRNALRLVTLLLRAGVTIDLRDSQGCFALCRAIEWSNLQAATLLVQRGAVLCENIDHRPQPGKMLVKRTFQFLVATGYSTSALMKEYNAMFGRHSGEEMYREQCSIYKLRARIYRERAAEVCIAMQSLDLPVLLTLKILSRMLSFSWLLRYSFRWDIIAAIKHFHDRDHTDE